MAVGGVVAKAPTVGVQITDPAASGGASSQFQSGSDLRVVGSVTWDPGIPLYVCAVTVYLYQSLAYASKTAQVELDRASASISNHEHDGTTAGQGGSLRWEAGLKIPKDRGGELIVRAVAHIKDTTQVGQIELTILTVP